MQIEVVVNAVEFRRRFRSLKNKSFAFGIKNATDRAGRFFITRFQREWSRKLDAKRRRFPTQVLRVRPAHANPFYGIVDRPTIVFNIAADEALRAQLYGATRRPSKSRAFVVPAGKQRRISRRLKTYIAGRYIFAYNTRGSRYVGTLAPSIKVDGTVNINRPIRETARVLPRLVQASLSSELRFRQR